MDNILDLAQQQMTVTVDVGTAGLKLLGNTKTAISAMDEIIEKVETMDATYSGNLENALGQDGLQQVMNIYSIFKKARTDLASMGI